MQQDEKKKHPHEHGKHPEKDKPVDPKAEATPQDDPAGNGSTDDNGDDDIDTPPQQPGNP